MKETLKPGIKYEHKFRVLASKTVPALYPESEEFLAMPEVFATGFLVGLLEWACIVAINSHIDWPNEQTVGTHIDVSHEAATPPGFEITARVELMLLRARSSYSPLKPTMARTEFPKVVTHVLSSTKRDSSPRLH